MKKFLSVLLVIIAAICGIIALLCSGGLFGGALFGLSSTIWGLLGLGAFVIAAVIDPETTGKIVENVGKVAGQVMGSIGSSVGSLVGGFFSNPFVWIVGGIALVIFLNIKSDKDKARDTFYIENKRQEQLVLDDPHKERVLESNLENEDENNNIQ